jgi:bacteriocin resistance YdeI/OmpD-like protein/uncharacterized protein DUF1905
MGARRQPTQPGTRAQKFLATVYRIWMLRYVDVPEDVAKALRKDAEAIAADTAERMSKTKYIPVVAMVNGRSVRTTLLPAGGGRYRMQFNGELRKAAQADTGDAVNLEVSLDRGSREIAVPPDLRAALKVHAKARKAFQEAPPGYRRQILKWLAAAKGERARMKRIDVVIDRMLERAILKPSRRKS